MPDQPEPRTVESGPVTLTPVSAAQDSTTSDVQVADPAPDTTSSDEGTFVSLEDLSKMSREELLQFCTTNELTPPVEAKNDAQDLLDWLLSEFGVDA